MLGSWAQLSDHFTPKEDQAVLPWSKVIWTQHACPAFTHASMLGSEHYGYQKSLIPLWHVTPGMHYPMRLAPAAPPWRLPGLQMILRNIIGCFMVLSQFRGKASYLLLPTADHFEWRVHPEKHSLFGLGNQSNIVGSIQSSKNFNFSGTHFEKHCSVVSSLTCLCYLLKNVLFFRML